jgi:hypothetical protein
MDKSARHAAVVLLIFVSGWLSWVGPLIVQDHPACGMECCLEGDGECCDFRWSSGAESGLTEDDRPSHGEAMRESVGAACPVNCLLTVGSSQSSSRRTSLPVDSLTIAGASVDPGRASAFRHGRDATKSPSIPRAPPSSII